jgi:hypothetical protein
MQQRERITRSNDICKQIHRHIYKQTHTDLASDAEERVL